jgi:hypothetical protein
MPVRFWLVDSGTRRQYWPVATLCNTTVSPGRMGSTEVGASGWMATNCSAAVLPSPLPTVAGAVTELAAT